MNSDQVSPNSRRTNEDLPKVHLSAQVNSSEQGGIDAGRPGREEASKLAHNLTPQEVAWMMTDVVNSNMGRHTNQQALVALRRFRQWACHLNVTYNRVQQLQEVK